MGCRCRLRPPWHGLCSQDGSVLRLKDILSEPKDRAACSALPCLHQGTWETLDTCCWTAAHTAGCSSVKVLLCAWSFTGAGSCHAQSCLFKVRTRTLQAHRRCQNGKGKRHSQDHPGRRCQSWDWNPVCWVHSESCFSFLHLTTFWPEMDGENVWHIKLEFASCVYF